MTLLLAKRQRAIDALEKEERRNAILDAAERLFIRHPDRLANVAEVASAAKLAKGTVYLYFTSKEEMLLALHGRHLHVFFQKLFARLQSAQPLTIDDMLRLTNAYIVAPAAFLPLASLCMGVMGKSVPADTRKAFFFQIAALLERAGEGLELHFPALPRGGGGAQLLNQSYALMIGLWQMMQPGSVPPEARARPGMEMFAHGYEEEIDAALRALWSGYLVQRQVVAPAKPNQSKNPVKPSKPRGQTRASRRRK
jgi:AcrR family transcriptional regulator